MKRIGLALLFLLFVFIEPQLSAASHIDTLGALVKAVRLQVAIDDCPLLPDSVLREFGARSLHLVSTDIGGIHRQARVVTVSGQSFYSMGALTIEVLAVSMLNNKESRSVPSVMPQFFQYLFGLTILEGDAIETVPLAVHYWGDSLQVIPTPINTDTLYLKCLIEHASGTDDSCDIQLRPAFTEAAILYCCYLSMKRVQDEPAAQAYLADYEKMKMKLLARYRTMPMGTDLTIEDRAWIMGQ